MNKLRRSKAAKITAFVLAILFGALITVNIAFGLILANNNLYTSDEASVRNKIFSYLAERTANDVINYFDCRLNYLTSKALNYSNPDYWESEVSLYASKYAPENSDVFFDVLDSGGNSVLNNLPSVSGMGVDYEFMFTRSFSRTLYVNGNGEIFAPNSDYDGTEKYTAVNGKNTDEDVTLPSQYEATDSAETTADAEAADKVPTEMSDLNIGKISPSPMYAVHEEGVTVNTEEAVSYTLVNISWDDSGELDGKYLFDPQIGLNSKIYSYCVEDFLMERKSGNTDPLVYFQSSYTVSESGYVTEFPEADENNVPEGMTATEQSFTVKVYIPKGEYFTARDIYYFADRAVSFGVSYRNALIPVSIIFFLCLTAAVIFILYSAGYTTTNELPYSGGIHKIPFDLATTIYAFLSFLLLSLVYNIVCDTDFNIALASGGTVLYTFCVLSLAYIESLTVRIRSGTVFKNTLIGKFFGLVKKLMRTSGLLGKALLIYIGELIILTLGVLFVLSTDNIIIAAIIAAIVLFPVTLAGVYEFNVILEGTERFSNGDIDTKIKEKLLFGPFKRFAANLNKINDTVNGAVSARVKSESMKTELITNVSHDLKTPLTSIVNYIDLLKKLRIDDPTAKEYIEVIDRQSQRLKKLTVDIVDASKAATGNIEVHSEKLDLRVMVSQTDGEYCDKLEKSGLSLVITVPENPVYVNVDGRLLWRVFDNITNNVCKYSMPGTRVYLALIERNGFASVIMRNISKNELNIPPEELTERFVRGDSSRNTEGSGLGLSIASSLTELMGGKFKISIDGDLFKVTVTFPSAPSTNENPEKTKSEQ